MWVEASQACARIVSKGHLMRISKWRLMYGGVFGGLLFAIWISAPIAIAGVFDPTYDRDFPISWKGAIVVTFLVCGIGGVMAGLLASSLTSRLGKAVFGGVVGFVYGALLIACVVPTDTLGKASYWPLAPIFCLIGIFVGGWARWRVNKDWKNLD